MQTIFYVFNGYTWLFKTNNIFFPFLIFSLNLGFISWVKQDITIVWIVEFYSCFLKHYVLSIHWLCTICASNADLQFKIWYRQFLWRSFWNLFKINLAWLLYNNETPCLKLRQLIQWLIYWTWTWELWKKGYLKQNMPKQPFLICQYSFCFHKKQK